MKKIVSIFLFLVSIFLTTGCGNDFSYFQSKVNSIDGYKYYTISQKVSNNKLILYEKNINVYFNNDMIKVITNIKEINSYEDDKLYNTSSNEFYVSDNILYYKEDGVWKTKNSDFDSSISVDIQKNYFKSYSSSKKDGKKVFKGILKDEILKDFLGYEINDAKNVTLNIETNSKKVLTFISLNYVSSNGNDVVISFKPNYSYVLDFNLPVNE